MKYAVLLLVVAVGMLAGCQQGNEQYSMTLHEARTALCEGTPEKAERLLAEAERVAVKHNIQQTVDAKLLRAESKLAQGDLAEALNLAREVQTEKNMPLESGARAEEIIGKAALRQGQFGKAQDSFIAAQRSYGSDGDKKRIIDLIQLSRGLAAYSQGDVDGARKY